jgi:hypothetical protein
MTTPMKDMFHFTPVSSWVENFNDSTRDDLSRQHVYSSFVMLPEIESSVRLILDRIHRGEGRGFLITGLYGSGKTKIMSFLSAILTDTALRKQLLDTKPEWGLDALAGRKYLTINFTAIQEQDTSLEEALWLATSNVLRSHTPPVTETLSNVDAFLDTFHGLDAGIKRVIEDWLTENEGMDLNQLALTEKPYQKRLLEKAISAKTIRLDDRRTTIVERVHRLIAMAKSLGYDGVAVFIDELYLHLIQSDENFNRGVNLLSQLAEAGLSGDRPFWIFGAVQEQIEAIALHKGRNYDTELMGRLAGQAGRFQYVNLPVTQFHRIFNHRLFRPKSKCVHKLAELFRQDIQPHYRGSFTEFFKRYFRDKEQVRDEAVHFADVYPMHPFALYCLARITNIGGQSRGVLGFVQEFIQRAVKDGQPWRRVAILDDVFDYEDLRNKIIQNDPDIQRYYGMFERFCAQARDEVLGRSPYRHHAPAEKEFVKAASERLVKALIVLAMVKEELNVSRLNDAMLLRWPGKENDPAGSDEDTRKLLDKIARSFSPLRSKGDPACPTFFLSVEGDGGEREELLIEIERVVNGFNSDIHEEPAYRGHLELFLRSSGSPLYDAVPPQHGFKSEVSIEWQKTRRSLDYRLERPAAMTSDQQVKSFMEEVPAARVLHLVVLFPSSTPLDVVMDSVKKGHERALVWLAATLSGQAMDDIKRSMACVRLYSDYTAQVAAGGGNQSIKRKVEILRERDFLDLPGGTTEAQPSRKAIEILLGAFINGEIRRWNVQDKTWETLCAPSKLLGDYNSIPSAERSFRALLQSVATPALTSCFRYHPDFQTSYSFSADLSSVIKKRLLSAIWKGRVVDAEAQAKNDLERHLAPLGLLDTGRPGEVSITLGAGSSESFRKIRERLRDSIRHATSDPKEISAGDVRDRMSATDFGLTETWVDIALTLLISLGELNGYTSEGQTISQDDRSVGPPHNWLPRLTRLRMGSRPDDDLYKDLTRSLQIMGLWDQGDAYTPASAERLLERLCRAESRARTELEDARTALALWPEAVIPTPLVEMADVFRLPEGQRESRSACFNAVRDGLRDVLGLPDTGSPDDPGRYTPVESWMEKYREAKDFISRVHELHSVASRLGEVEGYSLPEPIGNARSDLIEELEEYATSFGQKGSMATIQGHWKDFLEQYADQYVSEHAGLHSELRDLHDKVLSSPSFAFLRNFSRVDGLSAHYGPERIEREMADQLSGLGIKCVCSRPPADLRKDLGEGWSCTICGYQIGTPFDLDSEEVLEQVNIGIREYLQHIRGCEADILDYIADHPEEERLADLLVDPLSETVKEAMAHEYFRQHLARALADAAAVLINLEEILAELKPRMLGFYRGGATDFQDQVAEAVAEYVSSKKADKDKPWKVK